MGGWQVHAEVTGFADYVAETDEEALQAIRTDTNTGGIAGNPSVRVSCARATLESATSASADINEV